MTNSRPDFDLGDSCEKWGSTIVSRDPRADSKARESKTRKWVYMDCLLSQVLVYTYICRCMSLHGTLPMIGRVYGWILRFRSNRGGVKEDVGTLQGHGSCCLGEPLIPTNCDTNRHTKFGRPHLKSRVSRCKIKFFLISRAIGNMRFPIRPQDAPIGINHNNGIIQGMIPSLVDGDWQNNLILFCQLLHSRNVYRIFDRRCQFHQTGLLRLTKIGRRKQFGQ